MIQCQATCTFGHWVKANALKKNSSHACNCAVSDWLKTISFKTHLEN